MRVQSDRRYRFAVAPEALWQVLAATDQYPRWWPWLRQFEAGGLQPGERWRCVIKPPLPYTLRFVVELGEVAAPSTVTARVDGDIAGDARIDIAPAGGGDGSVLRLRSSLAPGSRPFEILAVLAWPLINRGHDWVLDTGAAQFAARAVAAGEG